MERRYYSSEALATTLASLERRYGVTSSEFYDDLARGESHDVPWHVAVAWAGIWEEHARVAGLERDVARGLERLVTIA